MIKITNRINPVCFTYQMKEHCLNEVSHTKYLGVLIDKRLTWSNHIDHITSKGSGFLQRNLISCPMQVKINFYNTFVRPILDYCSTIWSPYTMSKINKIEAIQRRAARFIFVTVSAKTSHVRTKI